MKKYLFTFLLAIVIGFFLSAFFIKQYDSYTGIKVSGIGTNLSNDVGCKPANIVMKLMQCRMNSKQTWTDCIKLSDDVGKHMGNPKEIEICKHEIGKQNF